MTWIVGTPSFFGYAIGISDIRVTFANGRTLDCLQKVYPVGRFIAAGFSGSVAFGFAALKNLSTHLDHVAPDEAWIPGWVAFKWHRHARRMFARAPLEIQRLGAEIMLLGVSPMVDLGIPGFARPTVAIMRSPDFSPQILPISIIGSIGNGAAIPAYVQSLQELNNDRNLMRLEVNSPGGYGYAVMEVVRATIDESPTASISPHVHICLVRRGEINIGNSNHIRFDATGHRRDITMPPVATTWEEFEKLCHEARADVTAAVA